jgi:hypothetical protein
MGGIQMVVVESMSRGKIVGEMRHVYFYRLVRSNIVMTSENGTIEVQSYGLEIERQDILNDELVAINREHIGNVSPHRHKVHNLLKLLYDNLVSPIHVVDVIGEYVDCYISDYEEVLEGAAIN